ncbi:hypothetical protein [Caballeronia udeis]|nr:hypothetical protein [Caballeronia udeis]
MTDAQAGLQNQAWTSTALRHHNRKRRNKYSVKPAQMTITPITIKNE